MIAALKRAFGRKYNNLALVLMAIATHLMTPMPANNWYEIGGMVLAWVAMLIYGFDAFDDGLERGINISNKLER
jgi:hypothetical protein